MKVTLYKYIVKEIWPTFLASLFVAVFIILATKLLSITELIVNKGVYGVHVLKMIIFMLPGIVIFSLPAVSLMAVLVAFLRLSVDNEIIALKSSGISLNQMMPPVVLLSFMGLIISLLIGVFAVPWGNRLFKDMIFQVAQSKADVGIRERIFCEPFDNVVFYVNSFSSREKVMRDVFVVDRRDQEASSTIIAKEGRILSQPEKRIITLRFINGTIFVVGRGLKSARSIDFKTYDLNIGLIDILAALAKRKKDPKEMSIGALLREIKITPKGDLRHNDALIQLLEMFVIPIAVFVMGLIGVPLGAQMKAHARSTGIGVSLFVFLVYYICFAGAKSFSEMGTIAPHIGMWIPDLLLLLFSIFFFRRAAEERSINLLPKFVLRSRRR